MGEIIFENKTGIDIVIWSIREGQLSQYSVKDGITLHIPNIGDSYEFNLTWRDEDEAQQNKSS